MADKKIIFITGGNTGIGYETVKALFQSGKAYHVLMGSRSLEKAKTAIDTLQQEVPQTTSTIEAVQIDVLDDDSIEKAFETVKARHDHIDSLINNAGAAYNVDPNGGVRNIRDMFNKTFDVNVSGAYVVTHVFMPLLLRSADPRLLFLTSGLSSLSRTSEQFYPIAAPPPAGWPKPVPIGTTAYRSTKTALNMLMVNLNFFLTEDRVKVWSISPGFLATGLSGVGADALRKRGAGEPAVGGNFIKDVVEGKRDADAGKAVFNDGSNQPW